MEKQEGWTKRVGSVSVQINEDEILLFGGSDDSQEGFGDCFLFNPSNNSMIKSEISNPSTLPLFTKKAMISKSNVLFVITSTFGILTFDIEQKQWNEDEDHTHEFSDSDESEEEK